WQYRGNFDVNPYRCCCSSTPVRRGTSTVLLQRQHRGDLDVKPQRFCCSCTPGAPAKLNLGGAVAASVQRQLRGDSLTLLLQQHTRCDFDMTPRWCCCSGSSEATST
ncbi:hypothetical protein KIN20_033781, partial [Parelaphostrongylus tenuis]